MIGIHLIERPLDVLDFLACFEKLLYHVGFRWGARGRHRGKPVLVLRSLAEFVRRVKAGTLVVGTDPTVVKTTMTELLTNESLYLQTKCPEILMGMEASERIVQAIKHYFGQERLPKDFMRRKNK